MSIFKVKKGDQFTTVEADGFLVAPSGALTFYINDGEWDSTNISALAAGQWEAVEKVPNT